MQPILVSVFIILALNQFSVCRGDQTAVDLLEGIEASNDTTNGTTTSTSTTPVTTTLAPHVQGANGHFRANYSGNNQFCVMMDVSSLVLDVTYQLKNGNYTTLSIQAPSTASVSPMLSSCGVNLTDQEVNEKLTLQIPATNSTSTLPFAVLTFFFTRSPNITGDTSLDKSQLYKINAAISYNPLIFVDAMYPGKTLQYETNGTIKEFVVLKDRSYQCNTGSTIKIDDAVTLKFTGLRVQAFVANNHFDAPEPCPADSQSSDLVPIIIGAVLAAIVLVVLIAYLIGRARMRRTTYESI